MSQERIIAEVGVGSQFRRGLARRIIGTPFRSEVWESADGLARAEQLLTEGWGLVILANHFSLGDPPRIFKDVIFASQVMRQRKILVPVAFHQFGKGLMFAGKRLDIELAPVVTEETLRRNNNIGSRHEGLFEYISKASGILQRGGVVLLFPQGTRSRDLESSETRAVSFLLRFTNNGQFDHLAFLLTGIGLADRYPGKIDGYNLMKKYQIVIGETYTKEEILNKAASLAISVDHWVFGQLANLASP